MTAKQLSKASKVDAKYEVVEVRHCTCVIEAGPSYSDICKRKYDTENILIGAMVR